MPKVKVEKAPAMKLADLSKAVSAQTGQDEKAILRTLRATMTIVRAEIAKGGQARIQGLGQFTSMPGKTEGKVRIRFKLQAEKSGKGGGDGEDGDAD